MTKPPEVVSDLPPEAQRFLNAMIEEAKATGDPNPQVTPKDIQFAKEFANRIPPEKPLAKIITFPGRR